jgi:hypothetical protein
VEFDEVYSWGRRCRINNCITIPVAYRAESNNDDGKSTKIESVANPSFESQFPIDPSGVYQDNYTIRSSVRHIRVEFDWTAAGVEDKGEDPASQHPTRKKYA